jgi:hypothetical protein
MKDLFLPPVLQLCKWKKTDLFICLI